MRSFWLASAATLFFAGAACAQTSTTTGPAPTGAPNAPVVTAPGASPGNTGTTATTGQSIPAPAMTNSGGPANNASGAPGGASVTPPGKSAGKTGAAGKSDVTTTASTMPAPAVTHHYRSGRAAMFMPENASADAYLHIALTSVAHHNKAMAEEALSRAETQMLNRAVPQGGISPDTSPGVAAIEQARQDVQSGRMKEATAAINTAMGGSGEAMPAPGPAPDAMAPPAKPKKYPAKKNFYNTPAEGLAPTPPSTPSSAAKPPGAPPPAP